MAPSPSARERAIDNDKVEHLSREELLTMVHDLRDILTAVRECGEADGRCRLCPHCVTRLYVVARPAPGLVPRRYTELPWRKR
jgi:hypothetical protein